MAQRKTNDCLGVPQDYSGPIGTAERPASQRDEGDLDPQGGAALEIFKLLEEFCSASHLKNLVKAYRPSVKDFPISVSSEELLRSVRKLHGAYHVPTKALEDLLERAEENGRQHIFLYLPASETARQRLDDFKSVQNVLLDGQTRSQAGLPKFQIHPTGVAIAD